MTYLRPNTRKAGRLVTRSIENRHIRTCPISSGGSQDKSRVRLASAKARGFAYAVFPCEAELPLRRGEESNKGRPLTRSITLTLTQSHNHAFFSAKFFKKTQVIQRAGIDPTYTVQMVAAIHISLEEAPATSKASRPGTAPLSVWATDHDGPHEAQETWLDGKRLRGKCT